MIRSTSCSRTFLNASKPTNCRSSGTSTLSLCFSTRLRCDVCRRSPNASAIAINDVGPLVFIAWPAAPVPRPPQPTKPILIVSSLEVQAAFVMLGIAIVEAPATAIEEFFRKFLRLWVIEISGSTWSFFGR